MALDGEKNTKLTSMSKLTTPVDLLLGFFFLVTGFNWVGVADPLPAPPTSESVPESKNNNIPNPFYSKSVSWPFNPIFQHMKLPLQSIVPSYSLIRIELVRTLRS